MAIKFTFKTFVKMLAYIFVLYMAGHWANFFLDEPYSTQAQVPSPDVVYIALLATILLVLDEISKKIKEIEEQLTREKKKGLSQESTEKCHTMHNDNGTNGIV